MPQQPQHPHHPPRLVPALLGIAAAIALALLSTACTPQF